MPLRVAVADLRTLVEIRSWLPEHNTGPKPVSVRGHELPGEVGAMMLSASHRILCLAPGEWWLVSDEKSFPTEMLADANFAKQGLVLTDVTDGFVVLEVRGPAARDVLSKGCGLDFHESGFTVGRCARTRFAQIPILIEGVGNSPEFDLYVSRSYMRYLVDWLEDATVEFRSEDTRKVTFPAAS